MSYDIQLFRKDKRVIPKSKFEKLLFKQHWICRTSEGDYQFIHTRDQCLIEITYSFDELENLFSKKKFNSIELSTWANSSEWSINHLVRLCFLLANELRLIVYDPQLNKIIKQKNIEKIIDSYFKWRIKAKALSYKFDIEPKQLIPITIFVACSFAPEDDYINDYIISFLRNYVKEVLTGYPYQPETITKKVEEKIKKSDILIAIFTGRTRVSKNHYRTSQWVKDEAVYALGAGKKVILIKENTVVGIPKILSGHEYMTISKHDISDAIEKLKNYFNELKNSKSKHQARHRAKFTVSGKDPASLA